MKIKWFKNKQKTNKYEELENSIRKIKDDFYRREEELNDKVEKLQRIVKCSSDKPTFNLDTCHVYRMFAPSQTTYSLYLYIDKEEYIIKLDELCDEELDKDSAWLNVEEDHAYFNISAFMSYGEAKCWTRHKFIIEFKNGRYVYSKEDDKERNEKEKVTLEIK